ncbi:MAG: hypothetical protein RLZZ566_1801, partial [Pseudomonadota bacterium]
WKTHQMTSIKTPMLEVVTEVLNKNAKAIGEKSFYNLPKSSHLNFWMTRLKTDSTHIPLKNAVHPQIAHAKVTSWRSDAIGYLLCNSNDLQNAGTLTALFSSVYSAGNGFHITGQNIEKAAIIFTVRLLIKHSWINHNDQFLQPSEPLSDEFRSDCLIWMLFHGKNLTASANNLEWSGKKWSIVNHFIPYTESEVNAPDRFESDFMVQYLADKSLSIEATAVLDAGRVLWKTYFTHTDARTVRETYKLNRADVGWYQIRNALAERNKSGDTTPIHFTPMETAYAALTDKLRPQVFSLGFLR